MKRLLLAGLAGLALAPLTGLAASASWVNPIYGFVANPQIDATNVVNYGGITASTLAPFETFDTVNFTNYGTLTGSSGWRFSTVPASLGARRMMGNFVNIDAGLVSAVDPLAQGLTAPCEVAPVDPSYLIVWATNIYCPGGTTTGQSLVVGPNGLLQLTGQNIDIRRAGVEVLGVWSEPQGDATTSPPTNFIPDIAVYDQYWAQASFSRQYTLPTASLWNGAVATSLSVPGPPPAGPAQPTTAPAFVLYQPVADSFVGTNGGVRMVLTNFTGPITNITGTNYITNTFVTNFVKQAVFAKTMPGASVQVGFSGGNIKALGALVTLGISNSVILSAEPAYIFIQDTLASSTNRGLSANIEGCPEFGTSRPVTYSENRLPNSPGGLGGGGLPPADFFTTVGIIDTNIDASTMVVTNATLQTGDYAAYSAYFDNIVSRPPAVPNAVAVTNLPGRLEITAHNLNLDQARIRAEGFAHIQADNLVSASNAVVDCENLSFDLSATNGNLNVQHLAADSVVRLRGPTAAWSAFWTNNVVEFITNNYVFSNVVVMSGTNIVGTNVQAFQSPLTNYAQIIFSTMMFDATTLGTLLPVNVYDITTHSTNAVINDNLTVIQSFLTEGQSLTLNGNVTIPGSVPPDPITGTVSPQIPLQSWTAANAPNLLYFTNNGYFFILADGHFGDDRARPYSTFVNTGTVDTESLRVLSSYFQNNGSLLAVGPMFLMGGTGKLENGSSTSGGVTELLAGSVKLNNYQLTSSSAVFFMVTNSLYDAGAGSASVLNAPYGFNLLIKPQTGDLLGSTFQSTAPQFLRVTHTWAGENRGVSAAGYSNNVAIGKLVPRETPPSPGQHYFRGTGTNNALYVDLLDLSGLSSYQTELQIDPSLVLYYAAARLNFTPPPNAYGIPQEPEEYLDGQFGGRLRWVSSFAGPNSSVAVVSNGVTILVNKALRNSKIIDSDGDGLPNYYDPTPFGGTALTLAAQLKTNVFAISWQAAPKAVYQVEYTTNLPLANWQLLTRYTNNVSTNRVVTIYDTNVPAGVRRFYRVGYKP